MRNERMRVTRARQLRKPIGEVAEGGTAHDGDEAKGGNGDTGARGQTIEKQNQPDDRCGWNGE